MARRPREDSPGSLHHVMNRGIARRTMFETEQDIRMFLAQMAHAVRRDEILVRAFAIMSTHFHALIHSLEGQLASAMGRIQSEYSRYFNRSRRRDGPLVRSRYASRLVSSPEYEVCVYAYIHDNPVQARIVEKAADYPYSSAYHFARTSHPRWLDLGPIERWIEPCQDDDSRRAAFDRVFTSSLASQSRFVVEQRRAGLGSSDPFVDLVGAAPEAVRDWMQRKATLADGTRPGMAVCGPTQVERAIRVVLGLEIEGDLTGSPFMSTIRPLRAGLLRDLAGLCITRTSAIVGLERSTVGNDLGAHRQLVVDDPAYAAMAVRVGTAAIEIWREESGVGELSERASLGGGMPAGRS